MSKQAPWLLYGIIWWKEAGEKLDLFLELLVV